MKKLWAIAAIAAMSAAACATTPAGGGGGGALTVGCHDSTTSTDSLIYNGPIGTYKNAQFAVNNTGCASDPLNDYVTVVQAVHEAAAIASCQGGPDPAVDGAANLRALGFDTIPANAWYCGNPLSGALLQPDGCFAIGTASMEYVGPRNSLNNMALHSGTTCSSATPTPFTWVQHSTQAAALALCAWIDPAFDTATTLSAVGFIPSIPNDTYLCLNNTP